MPFKFSAEAEQKLNTGVVNNNKPSVDKLKEKPQVKDEVKPKVETKLSNWDEQIAPVLDNHPELKKAINYNTSMHIMRAVNGRYDKAMYQLKQDDPKAYETFKKFKNNAWALANELKKIDSGGFNDKLANKYMKDADAYFDILQESYAEGKNKAWVMTDKAQLLSSKAYEKYKQEPGVDKEASTSAKTVFDRKGFDELVADYETGNVSKAYQKLKGQDTYFRDKGVKLMQPITKSWVQTSLNRIGEKGTNATTNEDALNLNRDILSHIGKYKTTLDPELAKKDQSTANSILNKLKGKTIEQQYQILKDNAKQINGMTSRMGYYGNAKIFNQYKKSTIGKDLEFYPASNIGKNQVDYFNMVQENGVIDKHIRTFRDFRDADSKVRLNALQMTNNRWEAIVDGTGLRDNKFFGGKEGMNQAQFKQAMSALVDENGNINSYQTFMKKLGPQYKYYEGPFGMGKKEVRGDLTENMIKNQRAWYETSQGSLFYDEGEDREEMMKIYSNLKKAYKKTFDDVKVKHVYDATLMDIGFGDERNQALSYKGVNLSVNKDMKLKETTGPKQENINKIFNLMFDKNGNVDTENITLFGNADVKSGLNAIQRDELKGQKNKNEAILKEFLKDDNDHITVTFLRNTNVPGQAAYKFYNPETKKSMMMFAPTSLLGNNGVKEDLYTKTGRDPLDFTFQLRGSLSMPVVKNDQGKPAYKSAELKYDKENDQYYGETLYYDDKGNSKIFKYTIPYGSSISVSSAQKSYLQFLTTNKNEF
jgi:hypothetical protein